MRENIKSLGIRRHHAVFNRVVHHLHKVSRAGWPAVQVAVLRRCAVNILTTFRWWHRLFARCKCHEDWFEALNRFFLATNHQAVAALQSKHAAADAAVDVVQSCGFQSRRTCDVVLEERIAAVNNRVAW